MDISKINPKQTIQSTESLDQDISIKDLLDDKSKSLSSDQIKKENKDDTNSNKKKRRSIQPLSVSELYEQSNIQSLSKKINNKIISKTKKTQLNQLQEKVKQGFNKELTAFIAESNQPKLTSLLKKTDIRTAQSNHEDPLIQDHETTKKETIIKTKQTQKEIIKQAHLLKNPELHTPLKNYIAILGDTQLTQSQEKKKKLNDIRTSLQEKGVSPKQLLGIEKGVQTILCKDIKRLIKNKLTELTFAYNNKSIEDTFIKNANYHSMLELAKQTKLFDANPEGLSQIKEDSKTEISNFLSNEIDRTLVETKLKSNSPRDLLNAFNAFNNLISITNLDTSQYLKTFQKKLDDEGLTPFLSPASLGPIDTNDHHESDQHQNKEDSESTEELENTLLNLEIKSHLSKTLLESIKTKLDLTLLKQTCKQKKIPIQTIEKQAHSIATLRSKMECRSLFEYRATLPTTSSPLHKKFKNNLKSTLKILKKLGHPMSSHDLRLIRDQSNKAIFTIIKEDYIKTSVLLETNPKNSTLVSQKKHLLQILNRIKTETPINEPIHPKMLDDLHFLNDISINEAA